MVGSDDAIYKNNKFVESKSSESNGSMSACYDIGSINVQGLNSIINLSFQCRNGDKL